MFGREKNGDEEEGGVVLNYGNDGRQSQLVFSRALSILLTALNEKQPTAASNEG